MHRTRALLAKASCDPVGLCPALGLLAGSGGCLLLPALPPWPMLAMAFAFGVGGWARGGWMRLAGTVLVGFGLAGLHAAGALKQQLPVDLESAEIEVVGRVVDLPQVEARRTSFRMVVETAVPEALRGRQLQLSWHDDFRATQPGPRLALHAGERWRMRVKLRAPRGLRNPGGFDTERHALAQRIAATGYVRNPRQATRLSAGKGIDAWRERMSTRIAAAVPVPSSRFVRALALGDTSGLSDDDWNLLRADGLTHLIAISGFHVGLAAGFFALFARGVWWLFPALLRRWPRQQAAGLSAAFGGLIYSAVAGFALPTVRTLLMIAIVVAACLARRQQRIADALALAAVAVLLVDPLAPLAAGFWLSFAGVAWLIWCLPSGKQHPVREFLGAQGVATLGLVPLTVVLFGQASLAGPFANLVAVPWWSLVVVPLALIGTALESVHAGWGTLVWRLSAAAFDLVWPLFASLGRSPSALVWLPESTWFALPLALMGAFWLLLPRGVPGKPLALLLWLPLLWPLSQAPPRGEVDIVMLDVGQGLSVLVRTSRHALLYDMGPNVEGGFDAGERAVVPALHALGVRALDMAMVSHGDSDHAGGLGAVRRSMPIRMSFGAPGDPLADTDDCIAGQRWTWDGVRFEVLHPSERFPYLGNESSCVLRIETTHGSALLTGDIGDVVEQRLLRLARDKLRADVVSLAHHGSGGSSSAAFVDATGAAVGLASAGYQNRFGHPKPRVVDRWQDAGAQVVISADSGAVRVRLGKEIIRLETRRATHRRLWDAVRRQANARRDACADPSPCGPRAARLSYRLD